MRLAYITNITIPAKDAQSIQVAAMAQAFFENLKEDFLLISPKNSEQLKTDYKWDRAGTVSWLPRPIRYLFLILFSINKVLKFKPDYIYSRDIFVVFFYFLIGYKPIYEIHKPFETKIGELLFKLLANKIRIIAISQSLRNYVTHRYIIDSSRLFVSHDAFSPKDFIGLDSEVCRKNLLKKFSLPESSFISMYSGNLKVGGKGVDLIMKAAAACKDVIFVLVGGHGFGGGEPKNIIFIPRVPYGEVPAYLKAADLLLLPFTTELKTYKYHSALKMFEYLASGVPILASNLGSITEIFTEDNSFLFNPEDMSDFISKIKFIKDNNILSREKSIQALKDSVQYTWQNRVDSILYFLSR